MKKALVVLSGGQDSTTCLFWAKRHYDCVVAVTFDYGQRHKVELEAAKKVAEMAKVAEHFTVVIGPILQGTSPLTSNNELEQYATHEELPGGLEKTFVPGRNMLFLALAANYAYVRGITDIVTGVCQEDYGGYPDCRQLFIDCMTNAIREALGEARVTVHAPLMYLTKAESIHMARGLPGCWAALAYTHTAYDGVYPPTGRDHANVLREKGFLQAGLPDPLVLRAVQEGLMEMPTTPNYDRKVLEGLEE